MLKTFELTLSSNKHYCFSEELEMEMCYHGMRDWFDLPLARFIDKIWVTLSDEFWSMFEYAKEGRSWFDFENNCLPFILSNSTDEMIFCRLDNLLEESGVIFDNSFANMFPKQNGYILIEYTEKPVV